MTVTSSSRHEQALAKAAVLAEALPWLLTVHGGTD